MKEDLYKKYLRNIKNGKTAIRKEYVDRGYFSYCSKRDIYNLSNSKTIIIDGFNANFYEFIDSTVNCIYKKINVNNKTIYLGKIGNELSNRFYESSDFKENLFGYNISISVDQINHVIKKHSNINENKRGQKIITKDDLKLLPKLLINSEIVLKLGKSKDNRNIYKFISKDSNGTYNLIEFISYKNKRLGFQSLYIQQKKAHAPTE